jgi:aryl-alcohol dehydrogenase-like predicted oxidoreductase
MTTTRRPLGRTGVEVSEIGFGAWGIGGMQWIGAEEKESLLALHRAVDLGVNFIDTALAYGKGESERIIGRLLKERPRDGILVATKVPPRNLTWPASASVPVSEVFPAAHLQKACDESLKNLGVERIDLLQLHVWHDAFLDQDGWRDAFFGLRQAGKVRFLGISVTEHDASSAVRAATSGLFDTMQILYNIFEQRPAETLLPLCREHGVGVLARVPFDEGGLTGLIGPDTTFPPGDFRNDYFGGERREQVFERCEALKKLLGDEARTLPELALRFCLSHHAVSTVIPGMRNRRRVEENAAVGDGRRLSPDLLERLKQHAWPRSFY